MLRQRTGRRWRRDGFTLIEVMVTVVIVAVLAAVAYPSFMNAVRKSRRAEAFAALSALQQAQERYRANQTQYAGSSLLEVAANANPPGLGLTANTTNRYYDIVITASSASGYTATATAAAGKSQVDDTGCQVLGVEVAGGNLRHGSGTSAADWTDPGKCWAK